MLQFQKGVVKINKKIKIVATMLAFILLCNVASAATLNVGPREKYKTIQSAVDAACNCDTIKVASGTYKEVVKINKNLILLGTKYPKVDGFSYPQEEAGTGTINGFSIQKSGIEATDAGGKAIIRNNYFYNCGIDAGGQLNSNMTIVNNRFIEGYINLYDTHGQVVIENTVSKASYGLFMSNVTPLKVSKNTFKNCYYAVYVYSTENPGKLTAFSGNRYINNKVNIGWGQTDEVPVL